MENNYKKFFKRFIKTNNIPKHILNKKFPINISSNELIPERNNLIIKILESQNSFNYNSKINKSKENFKKEKLIPNICALTKTPEKQNKYNEITKNNFSAEPKRMIYLNKTSDNNEDNSKRIYLSKLYRLPILLRNENNNSVKFNTINKIKINKTKTIETLRENSTKYSNNKIKQIPSLDASTIKKSIEYKTQLTNDKNTKNINIHFINYNKISLIKKNLGPIKITERINDSGYKGKENKIGFSDLENCLKDKFYVDTEARLKKKINDQDFNIDHSLKDKIIEMNKIGDFWGGILDYCNPIFTIKRYKYITDELRKKKAMNNKKENNINNDYGNVNELVKNSNKSELKKIARQIKSPNLYTFNSLSSSKHRNKLKIKKEFLEKYNDFQQYYLH